MDFIFSIPLLDFVHVKIKFASFCHLCSISAWVLLFSLSLDSHGDIHPCVMCSVNCDLINTKGFGPW